MANLSIYRNGELVKEPSKWESVSLDIINQAIAKQHANLDLETPIREKEMKNWGKWLSRIEIKVSEKQFKLVTHNLGCGDLKLCLDETRDIFVNTEFALFTPNYGSNYGVIALCIFQLN